MISTSLQRSAWLFLLMAVALFIRRRQISMVASCPFLQGRTWVFEPNLDTGF